MTTPTEHKTTVERTGVAGAVCWIAYCTCGWRAPGSSRTSTYMRERAYVHERKERR